MASSRVALVTGSSSGIGLGIARTLSRNCDVILTGLADRSTEHELLDEFKRSSTRASFFVGGNFTSKQGVNQLCKEVNVLYPAGVDILVNNAGEPLKIGHLDTRWMIEILRKQHETVEESS